MRVKNLKLLYYLYKLGNIWIVRHETSNIFQKFKELIFIQLLRFVEINEIFITFIAFLKFENVFFLKNFRRIGINQNVGI